MNRRSLGAVALMVVIGTSWVLIYRTVTSGRIDLDPYRALGQGAAVETVKLLHNSGRIILVDGSFGDYQVLAPTTEAQIRAFKKAIGSTGVKIAAVSKASIAPPSLSRTGVFMQPGQLPHLISQHSDADALVLFVGLAGREELEAARPMGGKPKLVVVANYEPYYKSLLLSRVIQLAIVPRSEGDAQEPAATGSQNDFKRNYLVITPEHAAQLPD